MNSLLNNTHGQAGRIFCEDVEEVNRNLRVGCVKEGTLLGLANDVSSDLERLGLGGSFTLSVSVLATTPNGFLTASP